MADSNARLQKLTLALLFLILLVYALIVARQFLYPIFMSVLFAYLLYPVVKQLENWGVPRILANFVSIVFSMALLIGILVLLYKQMAVFMGDFPLLQEKASSNIDALQLALERKLGNSNGSEEMWLREQVGTIFALSGGFITEVLFATTGTLTKFGLMPVYIFLMLYYRNKLERFILKMVPSFKHNRTLHIIDEIALVTKRYMAGVVIVILILCGINTAGLMMIGVEYALLLGVLSAVANFIPYFGTLIGGLFPLLYTLVVQGDPQKTMLVVVLFLIVQFTENNILTPNITGSKVNINPLFTILSIIVGGMLWDLPGMFVAVPFMGMFKVYCDNHPNMAPYSFLLGTSGTEKHALTIDKIKNWLSSKVKA